MAVQWPFAACIAPHVLNHIAGKGIDILSLQAERTGSVRFCKLCLSIVLEPYPALPPPAVPVDLSMLLTGRGSAKVAIQRQHLLISPYRYAFFDVF